MNFTHLGAFCAVAQTGSVTAAAQRLHVSQPALTREIRELEERLGVALFERMPRGMQLTEAGRLLEGFATQIFRLAEAAKSAVGEFTGLQRGHLSIAASHTSSAYLLPPLLDEFRQLYPNVTFDVAVMNTAQVQDAVLALECQLGMIEGTYDRAAFDVLMMGRDNIIAVASATHPLARRRRLSLGALAQAELVMREPGSGTRQAVEQAYARHGVALSPTCSIGSPEAIKQLLAHGRAVAWVPQLAVAGELAAGTLVPLPVSGVHITRKLHLIWRKGHESSPGARAFQALAAQNLNHAPCPATPSFLRKQK
jgi:DNA-binding transcriptional LysR family regulator